MFAGHFALALAAHARFPGVPPLPLVAGAGLLDVLNGAFVVAGLGDVVPDPSKGPYLFFTLADIDWDHSLLMACAWALAWGALFARHRTTALLAGALVLSHFVADWPVHDPDLALYPGAAAHLGLGLWSALGTGAWLLEGLFCLALAGYAWLAYRRRGIAAGWPCALVAVLYLQLSPWLSPMKFVAALPPATAEMSYGILVAAGFLLPGLLMVWLLRRAERRAGH